MGTGKDTDLTEHDKKDEGPNEQLFKEMGLDTCYAQDFAVSSLLSEIVILEKILRFQEKNTAHSITNERSRARILNEVSIKKSILIRILYKLEEEFAQKKRLTSESGTKLSLQDRQERAAFVRNTSNHAIKEIMLGTITDLETLLKEPPQKFTKEDEVLAQTALKLALELVQRF